MKRIFLVLAVLAGCATDPADAPPDGSGSNIDSGTAVDQFAAVLPILTTKCLPCHATNTTMNVTHFIDPAPTVTYDALTTETAVTGNFAASTAPILTKIALGHQSISYTDDERTKITAWLDQEVSTRYPATVNPANTETPSAATLRLMDHYRTCWSPQPAWFTATGGWPLTPPDNGECGNCHVSGAEGFIAARDVGGAGSVVLNVLKTRNEYMQQYYIVDLSGGVAAAHVIPNRANFARVAARQGAHAMHPRFDPSDASSGMAGVLSAYNSDPACAGPN